MIKLRNMLALAVAAVLASALGAAAGPFWGLTGGTAFSLPSGSGVSAFNPSPTNLASFGIGQGTVVYRGATLNLLQNVPGIRYEYHGKEAGNTNRFFGFTGSQVFSTATASVGQTATLWGPLGPQAPFGLKFVSSSGATAVNGTVRATPQIAFLIQGARAFAFFDDGGGSQVGSCTSKDCDFDDMIVSMTVIPLPAGAFLILGALGGLGLVAGRRRPAAA